MSKYYDIDIMNINEKDYLSYLSKKNKIHEEIKDSVIDRFIKIIYQQNNEIIQLKKKLEETIKQSLVILKKCLLKKKIQPFNKTTETSMRQCKQINSKLKYEKLKPLLNNLLYLDSSRDNNKTSKNTEKSFASFNRLKLKKNLKSHSILNQNTKMNNNNNNNNNNKNNKYENDAMTNRKNSRNSCNKYLTFDLNRNNTFFIDKNKNKSTTNYKNKRDFNFNYLYNNTEEKKMLQNESNNKKFLQHNSFYTKNDTNNTIEKIKNISIHNIGRKNKIRKINAPLNFNKAKKLNSFKNLNLSHNILKSDNYDIKSYEYCASERVLKNDEKVEYIFSLKNNNIFNSQKKNYFKDKFYNNSINKKSFTNSNKINRDFKLNKVVLKMKELNKTLNIPNNNHNKIQKSEKTIKKIKISDINNINFAKFAKFKPKTERFLDNHNNNSYKINKRDKNKKDGASSLDENRKDNSININDNIYNNSKKDSSFQTKYNPTFTSFLNRK